MIPVLVYKRNISEISAIHPEHPECIKSAVYSPRQGNNYHIPARLHGSCPLLNAFFLVIFKMITVVNFVSRQCCSSATPRAGPRPTPRPHTCFSSSKFRSAGKMVTHAQLEDVMTAKERGEVIKNRRRQQNVFLFSHKGFFIMKEESVKKSA